MTLREPILQDAIFLSVTHLRIVQGETASNSAVVSIMNRRFMSSVSFSVMLVTIASNLSLIFSYRELYSICYTSTTMAIKNVTLQDSTQSITKIKDIKQFQSKRNNKALRTRPSEKLKHLMELVNGLPATVKSWDEILQAADELAGTPLKEFDRGIYIFGEPDPDRPILAMEVIPNLFKDQVEELRSPAGRENLDAAYAELACELDQPGLVGDGEQRAAHRQRHGLIPRKARRHRPRAGENAASGAAEAELL